MPAVLDEIELIIEDVHGNNGGKPPSRDGDDGGGDGGGPDGNAPEPRPPSTKKYSTAIVLAMASIVVFFLVLTVAFLVLRTENWHAWYGIHLPGILWANTCVLLASSATLEIARRRLSTEDAAGFRRMWGLTTGLGLLFVAGQAIAWTQLAGQDVYGISRLATGFFYIFTVLHATHLLGGICALLYVGWHRFEPGRISRPVAAQVASYYWHFMDGLWLFLLALLYFGQ